MRLATGGRVAIIGTGAGRKAEIDFGPLMAKRGRISASTLRARSARREGEGRAPPRGRSTCERFTVPVEATYPLDRVAEAYEHFARVANSARSS